jgi:hypothetical protein
VAGTLSVLVRVAVHVEQRSPPHTGLVADVHGHRVAVERFERRDVGHRVVAEPSRVQVTAAAETGLFELGALTGADELPAPLAALGVEVQPCHALVGGEQQ